MMLDGFLMPRGDSGILGGGSLSAFAVLGQIWHGTAFAALGRQNEVTFAGFRNHKPIFRRRVRLGISFTNKSINRD